MKWLIERAGLVIRQHRAAVVAGLGVLLDVANGLPLLHAVARAAAEWGLL